MSIPILKILLKAMTIDILKKDKNYLAFSICETIWSYQFLLIILTQF